MVGRQGKNRVTIGMLNRNRVITELLKSPLHFSALKRKLDVSSATLTGHLEKLLEEGVVKRQVEGRKIVYVVVAERKDPTVLEMRKEFRNSLAWLMFDYGICLTNETKGKLSEALKILDESIRLRKQDVDVASRMMGIPETPIDETRIGRLKIKTEKEGDK